MIGIRKGFEFFIFSFLFSSRLNVCFFDCNESDQIKIIIVYPLAWREGERKKKKAKCNSYDPIIVHI